MKIFKKRTWRQLWEDGKKNKLAFWICIALRVIVAAGAVLQFINGNYESGMLCVATLLLFSLPMLLERYFPVKMPSLLEVIIIIFIFAANFLGEVNEFYIHFPYWDTMLHTVNGFLAASVGFSLVDILNRSRSVKLRLSPAYLAVAAFCFSMTIGIIWEFFEFGMDTLFHTDMQKDTVIKGIYSVFLNPDGHNSTFAITDISETIVNGVDLGINGYLDIGLIDTIKDLFVNFIGALTFSIFGFFYVKHRGKGKKAYDLMDNLGLQSTLPDGDDEWAEEDAREREKEKTPSGEV